MIQDTALQAQQRRWFIFLPILDHTSCRVITKPERLLIFRFQSFDF